MPPRLCCIFKYRFNPRLLCSSGNRYGDSFHRWWDDLGDAQLDMATAMSLMQGVQDEAAGADLDEMSAQRDAMIAGMLAATKPLR